MKVKSVKELEKTKWLSLKKATFIDKNNKEREWDYIERIGDQKVVTAICKSRRYGKYLFITQFRIPVNKIVVEFPAGLVDKGESYEDAALRELKEETGYSGEIEKVGPEISKSAGLSSETHVYVHLNVDENAVGRTHMDPSEEIQSFWMTPLQFVKLKRRMDPQKILISNDVWSFIEGYLSRK